MKDNAEEVIQQLLAKKDLNLFTSSFPHPRNIERHRYFTIPMLRSMFDCSEMLFLVFEFLNSLKF